MQLITATTTFLFIFTTVSSKLTIKEIYKQFDDETCVEGDIEVDGGEIINFINGQSSKRVKQPSKKYEEGKVIGSFFPDVQLKTPVSILNELAKINKLTEPFYHLENKQGPDHQPTFTILLLFNGHEFRAEGGSIKAAKNGAAQAALDSDIYTKSQHEIIKSPGKQQEAQTPISQLNNIAMKLKMKVEYIREKYQPEAEIYGGSHKSFINLGKKKSYEERLNASSYKTAKKGPDPDGDDSKGPFTYLVKVGDKMEFRANGITKKGAKHNAAERAVNSFKEMALQDAIDCLQEGKECNKSNVKSPISILQEMAQYKHFPITYTLVSETGLPHKKTFQIRCEVFEGKEKLFTDGEASSKKEAKKNAAMKMVDKLSTEMVPGEGMNVDDALKKTKKKRNTKSINRSNLLLLKEDVSNKIVSVYDYFTTENENIQQKQKDSSKQSNKPQEKITTDEDFDSFDESMDYKRHLHTMLDDYNLNTDYIEINEGHRKIALIIIPTNPKLICIAESVDIPSAKELVSYRALKWILNNSDFQFKNMFQDSNIADFKEPQNVFIYNDINEKTD